MTPGDRPAGCGCRGRWHYRRSLASRVILLTTMAVGLAVALVALRRYLTVRMQLQCLARRLPARPRPPGRAQHDPIAQLDQRRQVPSWALGAADVPHRLHRRRRHAVTDRPAGPRSTLGAPELAVAPGQQREQRAAPIAAGGSDYRVVAVPTDGDGSALVLAQSLEPQERVLRQARRW